MSDRIESMLEKVLKNQSNQDVKLATMTEKMNTITERGCSAGDTMVDDLEKATKADLAALAKTNSNDIKGAHKRIDKFKIAAVVLAVIGTILGLKGYPHAKLW